jgi:phosphate-selective porin OprO/OprP
MQRSYVFTAAALAVALAAPATGRAADDKALLERIESLESELKVVKRKFELKEEADEKKTKEAPQIGAGPDGFYLRSADKKSFQIKLRGYVQADGRFFEQSEEDQIDTFLMRRVRPIIEGTLFENIDFRIMPDFGQGSASLFDAYMNFRYFKPAQLQVGKFKPPVGLERLQSATNTLFIERGLPTLLVPTRDVGAMVHGDFGEGLFRYEFAAMNGVRDSGNLENLDADTDDGKDVIARFFAHPFKNTGAEPLQGLGLGIAATWGKEDQAPASFRTTGAGTRFFTFNTGVKANGKRTRFSPQGYWYWGPFGALFEYVNSQSRYSLEAAPGMPTQVGDNDAWQIALSYVLTGEDNSYKGIVPRKAFRPSEGTWGAWEVALRYGEIQLDDKFFPTFADPDVSAENAKQWTAGINWHLNKWAKVMLNYERTAFEGGAPGGEDREPESLIMTRFQISY